MQKREEKIISLLVVETAGDVKAFLMKHNTTVSVKKLEASFFIYLDKKHGIFHSLKVNMLIQGTFLSRLLPISKTRMSWNLILTTSI